MHFRNINVDRRNSYTNNAVLAETDAKLLIKTTLFKTLGAILHLQGFSGCFSVELLSTEVGMKQVQP
jgi:hypothetical protein